MLDYLTSEKTPVSSAVLADEKEKTEFISNLTGVQTTMYISCLRNADGEDTLKSLNDSDFAIRFVQELSEVVDDSC